MLNLNRGLACLAGLLLTFAIAGALAAEADNFPTRVVRIVVPFGAGGTADITARRLADILTKKWGQPVIIENPTGAAGNIGSEQAYRAEPDGYTLLSAPPPPLVINQNLYKNLNFDASKFERSSSWRRCRTG